jgi:hypothetical protein
LPTRHLIRDADELISSHARHVTALRYFLQTPRGFAEHCISDRMTEQIVDLFEVIEVDAKHGEA